MIKPTKEQVKEFEDLQPLVNSFYEQIRFLSSKKNDEALSKSKIQMINKVLNKVITLLKDQSISQFLELLDEESLPRYSDTLLLLSQFQTAMIRFRETFKPMVDASLDDLFSKSESDWLTMD